MPKYIRDRSKLAERLRLLRERASYPDAQWPHLERYKKHQDKKFVWWRIREDVSRWQWYSRLVEAGSTRWQVYSLFLYAIFIKFRLILVLNAYQSFSSQRAFPMWGGWDVRAAATSSGQKCLRFCSVPSKF